MRQSYAIANFSALARKNRQVFTKGDLRTMFPSGTAASFDASLQRLVKTGILVHAARGVYVTALAPPLPDLIEYVALALRRGAYSYVSLESALSEYGVISQIPVGRITVMTTGRSDEIETPFGAIEFVHTSRSIESILRTALDTGKPLRRATAAVALRDLRRAGRDIHPVDFETLEEITHAATPAA